MFELCLLFHTVLIWWCLVFITLLKLSFVLKHHLNTVQNVCHPNKWLGRSTNHTGGNTRCWRGNLFEITLCSFYTSIKTCSAEEEVGEAMRVSLPYSRECFIYIFMKVFHRCMLCCSCSDLQFLCLYHDIVIQVGVQFCFLRWKHCAAPPPSFCLLELRFSGMLHNNCFLSLFLS